MRIAPLIALLLLSACAPATVLEVPLASTPHRDPGDPVAGEKAEAAYVAEETACAAQGGHRERVGKLQALRCIVSFSDAGKACTDGAQCLGKRCMGDFEDPAAAAPATGTCVATNNPFGCNTIVEAGVARTLCVD